MKQIKILTDKIVSDPHIRKWMFWGVLTAMSLLVMYCLDPISRGVDFHFHYRRFISLMNALADGNIISYIDYNAIAGYGYMSNTFYPDFTLIPFAAIGLITGPLFAYKLTIFTMSILCGYFTYRAVHSIFRNDVAGYIAGILYTFCNYRLFDIFHRSSLGEVITFTFVPIVILGLYYILYTDYKKWYVMAIGFSLIIFSHAISSLLMFITVVIILLLNIKRLIKEPKRVIYLIIAGVATLLVTGYYIYPMAEQMLSNTFYYNTLSLYSANKFKIGIYWLICGMTTGPTYEYMFDPPRVGLILTGVVCLRLFAKSSDRNRKEMKIADTFSIVALILLIIVSEIIPWSVFPFSKLNIIQFPWRLLEFVSFFFAVAGTYYMTQIGISNRRIFILIGGLVLYTGFVVISEYKVYKTTADWSIFSPLKTLEPNIENNYLGSGREYLPSCINSPESLIEKKDVVYTNAETANLKRDKGILSFDIKTITGNETLELPLLYYKGYSVTLNGKELPIEQSEHGLVQVSVDESGRVEASYKGTVIQKLSFILTVLSILGLCIYIYSDKKKRKKLRQLQNE